MNLRPQTCVESSADFCRIATPVMYKDLPPSTLISFIKYCGLNQFDYDFTTCAEHITLIERFDHI